MNDESVPTIVPGKGYLSTQATGDRLHVSIPVHRGTGRVATFTAVFELIERSDGLRRTIFSIYDPQKRSELSLYVSRPHGNRLVLYASDVGNRGEVVSDFIVGSGTYTAVVVRDIDNISVFVDGLVVLSEPLTTDTVFTSLFTGCRPEPNQDQLDGWIEFIGMREVPLLYPAVLKETAEWSNKKLPVYKFMKRYFRYSLVEESEIEAMDRCLASAGFSKAVRAIEFALPHIIEQFPAKKHFIEEDIRDWTYAIMASPGRRLARELYSKIGRSDLVLEYSPGSSGSPDDPPAERFHIEFKIWGREGYKVLPSQPLKYLRDNDVASAVVLIDRRQEPSFSDVEKVITSNQEFPCLSVTEYAILETDLRYIVSFHKDPRFRTPRVVLTIHLPIAS